MKFHSTFLIFFIFATFGVQAQPINPKELDEEITRLNNDSQFETSLLRLEEIISGTSYSDFDKYHAFLQKAYTYKRVFNYPAALENLDSAYEYGMKTAQKEEVETRIQVEKMFVYFDLMEMDEAARYLERIKKENLKYIESETLGFYYNVVAVLQMHQDDFSGADEALQKALEVMKKEAPRHVAAVYAKIIGLSEKTGDLEKAETAFNEGIQYAEKYKMELYKIRLYSDMSSFYFSIQDYKNGLLLENLANSLNGEYNAPFKSGELHIFEKEQLHKKLKEEESGSKFGKTLLIGILLIFAIVMGVILYIRTGRRRKNKPEENPNTALVSDLPEPAKSPALEEEAAVKTPEFTTRQKEIIQLVRMGKSNKEIAAELFISENTVKYHLKSIYQILGINSRHEIR